MLDLAGYSDWQVSNDSGTDATIPAIKDEVHAVGVQVGIDSWVNEHGTDFPLR